jgi:hypothetical protein
MTAPLIFLTPLRLLAIVSPLCFAGCTSQVTFNLMGLEAADDPSKTGYSIPLKQIGDTHHSSCVWVGKGDTVKLKWDTKVRVSGNGHPVQFKLRSHSTGQESDWLDWLDADVSDVDGQKYRLNGNVSNFVLIPFGSLGGQLQQCAAGRLPNPWNECRSPLTDTCAPLLPPPPCESTPPNFPFFTDACSVAFNQDQDATIWLAVPPSPERVALVPPTIFVVKDRRPLGRPLARAGQLDELGDPANPIWAWTFQEQGDEWDDNFSPSVAVETVEAIFTDKMTHLKFDKLIIRSEASPACHPDDSDPTRVSRQNCDPIRLALADSPGAGAGQMILTPAQYDKPQTAAAGGPVWEFYFKSADNPELSSDSQVTALFTLKNLLVPGGALSAGGGPAADPWMRPNVFDFGYVQSMPGAGGQGIVGSAARPAALRVSAEDAGQDWTLIDMSLSGNNPGHFSAQLRDLHGVALTLPHTLRIGQYANIDLGFDVSGALDWKEATITVTVQDQSGQARPLTATVEAYVTPPPGYDPHHICGQGLCRKPH